MICVLLRCYVDNISPGNKFSCVMMFTKAEYEFYLFYVPNGFILPLGMGILVFGEINIILISIFEKFCCSKFKHVVLFYYTFITDRLMILKPFLMEHVIITLPWLTKTMRV